MSETVIEVDGLYKKFCRDLKTSILYSGIDITRSMLNVSYKTDRLRKEEFWALENLQFNLHKGETLGIVGLNGSGKSTLLRILNGIYPPDAGKVVVNGRIGALIAVGAGFHPHMTGKENIYLNGSILGMSRREIDENFQDIVNFAEIGDFLEAPVATYSSGMTVRLGFSIAIHVKPDILLVDEILSVGDLSFRNKSMRRMTEYRQKANALIFVSHNMEQMRVLCDRVMVLDKGKKMFIGETYEALRIYEEISRKVRASHLVKSNQVNIEIKKGIISEDVIEMIDIGIKDLNDRKVERLNMKDPLIIFLHFKIRCFLKEIYFVVSVLDEKNNPCIWMMSNENNKARFKDVKSGEYVLDVNIPDHHLRPNVYYINYAIRNQITGETYQKVYTDMAFRIVSDGNHLERGVIAVEEEWKLSPAKVLTQ